MIVLESPAKYELDCLGVTNQVTHLVKIIEIVGYNVPRTVEVKHQFNLVKESDTCTNVGCCYNLIAFNFSSVCEEFVYVIEIEVPLGTELAYQAQFVESELESE